MSLLSWQRSALLAGALACCPSVVPASEEEPPKADWSACDVRAELLATGPGGSRTLARQERLLILGENLDFEETVTLGDGSTQALVRLQVRVRASTALDDGVMYLVTSEGELQAAVGFTPQDGTRNQFRHDFMEMLGGTSQIREVFASPELGMRVLLVVSARPAADEPNPTLIPTAPDPESIVRLRVGTATRTGDTRTKLQQSVLQAALGRAASFSLALRPIDAPTELASADGKKGEEPRDPRYPLGGSVRVVDLAHDPDSGFLEGREVERTPADDSYMARNAERADQSWIERHAVDLGDGPKTYTVREPKKKKLSKKKLKALRDAAEIQAVQEMARERQMTLAGQEEVPAPLLYSDELAVSLRPLRATRRHLRMEIHLQGAIAAKDAPAVPIDHRFVQNLAWGQTLEFGIRELVEGLAPEEDTLLAITPIP